MALIYEPANYRKAREERQKLEFPELEIATPNEIFKVDQSSFQQNQPLSTLGQRSVDNYLRLGIPDEEVRAIEGQTQQIVQGIHGADYLGMFAKPAPYAPEYVPSPVAIQQYLQNQPIQQVTGASVTPGFGGLRNPQASNVADYLPQQQQGGGGPLDSVGGFLQNAYDVAKRSPIGGDVIGLPESVFRAGQTAVNLGQNLKEGELPSIEFRSPREQIDIIGADVLGQAVSANPPTAALDLIRQRQQPTNLQEGLGTLLGGFQDIDTVTGLPIRTPIRQGSQALTDPAQALREQFQQEQQGGIGYGLEGSAPFEALRNIPGIEANAPGTDISAFDVTLGLSDALLDAGSIYGAARSGPILRTYQQLTNQIPAVGFSLRNVGPDIQLLKATLNLPADASDDAVIAAAQRARPGIRAISLSQARGPEAVQIAQQQLDIIDRVLANAPPPGALPTGTKPLQLGATPGQELYVAMDRNTGRYVVHSNLFTPNVDEATRFLSADDAQRFAASQPYPVDLWRASSITDEAGSVVSRETPVTPSAFNAPPAPNAPTPGRIITGGTSGPPGGVTRPPATGSPGLPAGPGRVTSPPTRTLDPLGNVPKIKPYEPQIIPQRIITGGQQANALPSGSGSTIPGIGRINRAPAPTFEAFVDQTVAISRGQQILRTISDIANLPRAVMSSIDHSFPGRQGLPLWNRGAWWQAWGPSLRAWAPQQWDDYATRRLDQLLGGPKTRALAEAGDADALQDMAWVAIKEKYGLQQVAFGDLGQKLSTREEGFVSRYADKIPLVGASERGYVSFGNELRDGFFKTAYEKSARWVDDGAMSVSQRDSYMTDVSKWLNNVTGRGNLPDRIAQSDILAASNATFFSPRYNISRFQTLGQALQAANPTSAMTRQMRLEIARDVASYVGLGVGVLGLMDAFGWIEVELDPRSSDFGKGRIPLTGQRYDPWSGFQQIARYTTQIITGERKTTTGEVQDLEGGPIEGRLGAGVSYLRSKLAPGPSLLVDLKEGQSQIGEPVTHEQLGDPGWWVDRFSPLSAADIYTGAQAEGFAGALKSLPAIVGIGFNQYQGLHDVYDAIALETKGELYRDLNKGDQRDVRDDPRAQDKLAEYQRGDDPGDLTREGASALSEQHKRNKERLQEDLKAKLDAGISGQALREAIAEFKGDLYVSGQAIFEGPLGLQIDEGQDIAQLEDILAELYWSAPVPETVTEAGDLRYDFDTRDSIRADVIRQAEAAGIDLNYITGSGEGTYRGARYDDETVRQAVEQYEQFQTRMDDTGFFDLRDQAWVRFREDHFDQLGNIDDYWAWRESEILTITQEYVSQRGYDPVSARQAAEDDVAGYQTVTQFNEFYRTEFRHSWVVDFPQLALEAMNFGYFNPDSAEQKFLIQSGGGTPPVEEPKKSSAFGSGFGSVFGR